MAKDVQKKKLNLQSKENEKMIKHNITINNCPLKDRDTEVSKSRYLNIKIIEYAPNIFAYLRNLEEIDLDEMIESFLPKNNKRGIDEYQGKSNNFYISTDDNYYIVKTIKNDEFEFIKGTFLDQYVQYLTHNPQSFLCRIYGIYDIISSQGRKILIIVMRNVIGDFQDNIIAKYDLNGSTENRKINVDMENIDSITMNDLNFNEYEHGIMISRENIKGFRKIIKFDSSFLCRLELMNYSVFLVKISLGKKEQFDVFGEKNEKKASDFEDLMSNNIIKPSRMGKENNLTIDFDKNDLKKNEILSSAKGKGKIYKIKHYRQYLFPSFNPETAYIFAIINYFQMFNFYKSIESGIKRKLAKNGVAVSCVDPKTYSLRFIKYFEKLTDIKGFFKDRKIDFNNEWENEDEDNYDIEFQSFDK